MPRERLSPDVFRLPVDRIRAGYYSDAYFNFTKQLLEREDKHAQVVMQVFQKKYSVLGGVDEAIAVLKLCADDWSGLEVKALYEGDAIEPHETVMTIEGDYRLFAHLETVYLGCMARRSLVMRNVREVVEAARAWARQYAHEMNVTVLVDFDNDSVSTAIAVADALGDELWGVRLDTSERLVDRSLWDQMGDFQPTGVNHVLVEKVRRTLDDAGHERVKIVASGGFNPEKIRGFERLGVPVDAYGVGSSLLRGENDFTADIVIVDGRPCAKVGRHWRPNPRLEKVE